MKITLIRHGQTESNNLGICQGSTNLLLNNAGRRECQRLRVKIKDKHYDVCYTSPLARAVETAMILIGDRTRMLPDKRLDDRTLGQLEGQPRSNYNVKLYWDYKLNSNEQGVEPVQDMFKRCRDFLEFLYKEHSKESVMIVSHTAIIRTLRHILLKSDLNKELEIVKIENCYFEEFEIDDK